MAPSGSWGGEGRPPVPAADRGSRATRPGRDAAAKPWPLTLRPTPGKTGGPLRTRDTRRPVGRFPTPPEGAAAAVAASTTESQADYGRVRVTCPAAAERP